MNKQQRIFEFASGYSVAVKPGYDNRMIGLLMSAWDSEHPAPKQPEPTEVEEKIKGGGIRRRKLFQEPNYLAALAQHRIDVANHETARAEAQTKLILSAGIDPASLDMGLIERARQALENQYGTRGEDDDILFYLNLVGDSGAGKPGDEDYRPNELFELIRFISLEKGPPGALVQHLLMTTFQNEDNQPENGAVPGYLGNESAAGDPAKADPAGTVDADSGS